MYPLRSSSGYSLLCKREASVDSTGTDTEQKQFSAIYRALIAYLARREHSLHELTQKLSQRFAEHEQLISLALNKAIADGYQSDQRFAEAYTRSRINKGFGRERIVLELRQKGVSQELIEHSVSQLQEGDAEHEALAYTWQKKFNSSPKNFNEKMKQIRFLRYRGFSAEQIECFYDALESGVGVRL